MKQILVDVVAAAFIRDTTKDREILLFRRAKPDRGAGFWECPGGKIESGETEDQALVREILEELGVEVKVLDFIGENTHEYSGKIIHLKLYRCSLPHENFVLTDHDQFAWVSKQNLAKYPLSAVDIPLVDQCFKESFLESI